MNSLFCVEGVDFYCETATLIGDIRVRPSAFDENVVDTRESARVCCSMGMNYELN